MTTIRSATTHALRLALASGAIALAACGGSSKSPTTDAVATTSRSTIAAPVGSASAQVTVGSASKTLTGGSCTEQGGALAVNFGAVGGSDYVGALIPDGSSKAETVTAHIDGKGGNVVGATATVGAGNKTVTLAGHLIAGDAVSIVVTC